MKDKLKYLFLLLAIIVINHSYSQPGWQDITERYFYNITDEKGKEISFKKDKNYRIMIDDVLYKSPNIPQHKLKIASDNFKNNNKGFETQIRINDFSLVVFQQERHKYGKDLEIKIIHKKDTLFISQVSGIGSGEMRRVEVNGVYEEQKVPADFILQFIPGHYFFPSWTKAILDNIPETSGNVKIVNVQQRNFIVSETPNPSIFQRMEKYRTDRFNAEVVENFKKGYFSLEQETEPTQIENEGLPVLYPTFKELMRPALNDNEHAGLIEYYYESSDYKGTVTRFASINAEENSIKLCSPTKETPYFSTFKIYNDVFNKILYNRSIIRDTTCHESQLQRAVDCRFVERFYRSSDGGKIWKEDTIMTQLFDKYSIKTFEFLDAEYALAYKRDYVSHRITQGVYYLLKNLQIVDSLKSPEGMSFSDNYSQYRNVLKRDVVFLGHWYENPNDHYSDYFQPYLSKTENQWKFNIVKLQRDKNGSVIFRPQSRLDSIKEYQNFTLVNKNKLIFKNGAGTLTLKENVVDDLLNFGGYHILENGNQIYLINHHGHTYFSHNGGLSWLLYPLPLKAESNSYDDLRSFRFLKINEQGTITYLNNGWEEGKGRVMQKMFHQFIIE
ncbi:MAG: hypothetical protein PHQ74_11785 [Crocinitomicaceae bacterium]|nr:hypothetical protein [Crocinitomicaceae bacterium]